MPGREKTGSQSLYSCALFSPETRNPYPYPGSLSRGIFTRMEASEALGITQALQPLREGPSEIPALLREAHGGFHVPRHGESEEAP
jgi:hypothetical protein